MKLAFSICSLTCLPWSFHTSLCLSASHYSLCTALFLHQSQPDSPLPQSSTAAKQGNMKHILRVTTNMPPAAGADSTKTKFITGGSIWKMINKNTCRAVKHSNNTTSSAIISMWTTSAAAVLPSPPADHPVCLGTTGSFSRRSSETMATKRGR